MSQMTYIIEIKLTPESKPLIDHLRSLKYVKMKRQKPERGPLRAVKKPQRDNAKKLKWNMVNKHLKSSKN
jgi:hypothetical protein